MGRERRGSEGEGGVWVVEVVGKGDGRIATGVVGAIDEIERERAADFVERNLGGPREGDDESVFVEGDGSGEVLIGGREWKRRRISTFHGIEKFIAGIV